MPSHRRRERIARLLVGISALIFTAASHEQAVAIPWPFSPFNQQLPIGNSYGEYQNYGGAPYLHPGIDILQAPGAPVFAVKSGYVKAVLTTAADLHWRVAIGDSAGDVECDGWLYAHLDLTTIPVLEDDFVNQGDYLGDIVRWPVADFHHCHFVKIRQSGFTWTADWEFHANPMDELVGVSDPNPPTFATVNGGAKFAFLQNNTHTYFAAGQPVSGDVDIIANIRDRVAHPTWQLTPDQVTYEIHNDTMTTGEIVSFAFTGPLYYEENVDLIFQDDTTYDSKGDYSQRIYYFIVTKTDGDSVVEATDADYSWRTQQFNNGDWWVKVRAYDHGGNVTTDSMKVTVANYYALAGRVVPCDGDPDSSGATITAPDAPGAPSTSTDVRGDFSLSGLPPGVNRVVVSRPGYLTKDTVMTMPGGSLSYTLAADYFVGDLIRDSVYDVLDVVRLIEIVFRGSNIYPIPFWSGDTDFNRVYDVLDVTAMVGLAFRGNPAPALPCGQ